VDVSEADSEAMQSAFIGILFASAWLAWLSPHGAGLGWMGMYMPGVALADTARLPAARLVARPAH